MKNIIGFFKNETVLCIAVILALVSAFFVGVDAEYINYIDFRTLALLFCLMTVMAGFQKTGVFTAMAQGLLRRVHSIKGLALVPVMLCFFFSMLITNDVALITFVPFTFVIFDMIDTGKKDAMLISVVAMQTTAANLGSMLTPIGNPQNLYLYSLSGMGAGEFMMLMLPYTAVSFVLFLGWAALANGKRGVSIAFDKPVETGSRRHIAVYSALFILCLLTVGRVIDWRVTTVIVTAAAAVNDRSVFSDVDYTLLATFAAFFVFIGNVGRIPLLQSGISGFIAGRECLTGILSSQLISNVPAAILLSGFTDNIRELIVGVNLGGLGTLIASMASLISFKMIGRNKKRLRGRYLLYFTAVNVIFLVLLLVCRGFIMQFTQN